uniref:Uncharacterized protein n=1 Tax=Anguilla anguilla TaxID=7936 RepID=A0A0E9PMR1_ANGAN
MGNHACSLCVLWLESHFIIFVLKLMAKYYAS